MGVTSDPPAPQQPPDSLYSDYFRKWNYADRALGTFSMYWFARRYYAVLVRRYAPEGAQRVLEVGCGLGDLAGLLSEHFSCVGIDQLDESVAESRRRAPHADIRRMSAEDLSPFDDGSFDAVVSLHVIEHLTDPAHVINEVFRLLTPGGLWMFATPQPDYWLRRRKNPRTDAIGKDPTHINVHGPQQWRSWCESSGFTVMRHFADGLWDVPYFPIVPKPAQFAILGLPALLQVATRMTWTPVSMGVNQILVCRRPDSGP